MRNLINLARRIFSPRRLARRGSILIMVVAVLVLLALMGTAYISTARLDRTSVPALTATPPQEVINQFVPTVQQMVQDAIVKDLFLGPDLRSPYAPTAAQDGYDHSDYAASSWALTAATWTQANDAFLGGRLP